MSLYNELKRRNVFRAGIAYLAAVWFLVQIVETIFPAFGFSDVAVRNVVIVFAIGLIPTLIFSWVFEITPEGLKRAFEVDRSQSIATQTGKNLDRIIIVVLTLALGYFTFDKFVLEPTRVEELVEETTQQARSDALVENYGDKSIAVLAFMDMSADKDQEYMSDGIAEELLNLLAKIPELRVISRSSAFSIKGQNLEIPEIARRLKVGYILEGSVRKAGNQVRITAQLIEARSDTHLWSQTYDRTLDNIFTIQDEIAATVVDKLKLTLLGETPTVRETDPEAFTLFLQARYLGRQYTSEGWEQSSLLYQQALALDPDYAAAWEGLAGNYMQQVGNALRPIDEGYALAREAANRALEIDPENAAAHDALSWISSHYDGDLATAARHLERALALEPNNPAILGNAAILSKNMGRLDEAIALLEYVNARDPVNPIGHANLGTIYLRAGRLDEAITSTRTALTLSPGMFHAHCQIGVALLLNGEPEAALMEMQQEPFEAWRLVGLAKAYHALGQATESDTALVDLIEKYEQDAAYNIAYVLAFRNEADRAFEWLDKAVQYSDPGLANIAETSEFLNIQNDPRWLPFLERIGKSPAQLDAIEFKVTLPE
jgi:TolB-like protein/Flp pilus assembly protein TadD